MGCSSTRAPRRWARGRCAPGRGWPACAPATAAHLSPAGQLQVATALEMLAARLYGAGSVTALALTCWLAGKNRFSSSRKAVRFTGLDVTVHSSECKGPPGRLSRQGPPVLRWAVYEAGQTHARTSAPGHGYY